MKTHLITIIGVLISFTVSLAQNQFNRVYPVAAAEFANAVIEVDDGYILAGGHVAPDGLRKMDFIKLDLLGNVLFEQTIGDSSYNYFQGSSNSMIQTADGNFVMGSERTTNTGSNNRAWLVKFDPQGDTLWSRIYSFPNSFRNQLRNCLELPDKDLVAVGTSQSTAGNIRLLLIRTDSIGNLRWFRVLGSGQTSQGFSIDYATDRGFIIGGRTKLADDNFNAYVLKTDSLGIFEWDRSFGGPFIEGNMQVRTLQSGDFIAGSRLVLKEIAGRDSSVAFITKMNQLGDTLWTRTYGPPRIGNSVLTIRERENGNIVAQMISEFNWLDKLVGRIIEVDSNGSMLKERKFEHDPFLPREGNHIASAAALTRDGGIISVGNIEADLIGETQDLWVVKFDSNLCSIPQCDPPTAVEPDQNHNVNISVYPNPTDHKATVSYNSIGKGEVPTIQLFNILGQESPVFVTYINNGKLELNMIELLPGQYFLHFSHSQGLSIFKIIKQ